MSRQQPAPNAATLHSAAMSQPEGPNVAPSAHEREAALGQPQPERQDVAAMSQSGDSPGNTGREERIRSAAYALSAQRGFASGHEDEDWLEAERQIDGSPADSRAD